MMAPRPRAHRRGRLVRTCLPGPAASRAATVVGRWPGSGPWSPTRGRCPTCSRSTRTLEVVVGRRRRRAGARAASCGTPRAASLVHAAGVIHPDRGRRLRPGERRTAPGWSWQQPDGPASAAWCTCRRTARSARTPDPTTSSATTSRTTRTWATAVEDGRPSCRPRARRAGLDAVIVRPPWFYGPVPAARQTTFFTLVRTGRFPVIGDGRAAAVDGLRRQPRPGRPARRAHAAGRGPGATGSPTPGPTRRARSSRPSAGAARRGLRGEADSAAAARRRRPGRRDASTGALQRRGRYQQQLHVLGEMDKTIACDISAPTRELGYEPAGRAVRRDAPQHPLVPRAGHRAVSARRRSSPAGVATSVRCSSGACSPPGRGSGCSTSTTRTIVRRTWSSSPATSAIADAVRARGRRRRRRVPQRRAGAARPGRALLRTVNVDGTRDAARRRMRGAGVAQGRPHLVERGVRRTRDEPGAGRHRRPPRGGLRTGQARRRMGVPRPPPPRARRLHRAAAHHPRPRPARHLRHPLRLDRRRRRRVRARRRRQPLPVRARRRPRRRLHAAPATGAGPGVQRRHRPFRHHARDARAPVRPRRHRRAGPLAARPAGRRWRCGRARARARAVRPVPLDHVLEVDVVRPRPRPRGARLAARVLDRRRCSPRATTGSSPTARTPRRRRRRTTAAPPSRVPCGRSSS